MGHLVFKLNQVPYILKVSSYILKSMTSKNCNLLLAFSVQTLNTSKDLQKAGNLEWLETIKNLCILVCNQKLSKVILDIMDQFQLFIQELLLL